MNKIATVIQFCTNETRFLKKLIEEASIFSEFILIPICDHFFNGEPERMDLLHQIYADFPNCQFLEFAYPQTYHPLIAHYSQDDLEWSHLWHSISRYIGALFLPTGIEAALFLDADEIIDGQRFAQWIRTGAYRQYAALRLGCYAYAYKPSWRSTQPFTSGLLIRELPDPSLIVNLQDRSGWFDRLPEPKEQLLDEGAIPFIHHYSWVRTKEECLLKSKTWGHRFDKEWPLLIDQMFSHPDPSNPLDLKSSFEEAEVYFDPLNVSLPVPSLQHREFPNVLKVTEATVRRKAVESLL